MRILGTPPSVRGRLIECLFCHSSLTMPPLRRNVADFPIRDESVVILFRNDLPNERHDNHGHNQRDGYGKYTLELHSRLLSCNPAFAEFLTVRAEFLWRGDKDSLVVGNKFIPKFGAKSDLFCGLIHGTLHPHSMRD